MNTENLLFSRTISAGKRKYYFDIRKAKNGSRYLVIKEISEGEAPETTEKRSVMVFENIFTDFSKAFYEAHEKMSA